MKVLFQHQLLELVIVIKIKIIMAVNRKNTGVRITLGGSVIVLLLIVLLWSSDTEPSELPEKSNITVSTPPLPDSLYFCGERVPLEYFDVREQLERELSVNCYWHSQTIWLLQKANRFFPAIEKILEEKSVPDDFKFLVVAESGFDNVVSPAGATGLWQLMEGTAKDYGLEVNKEVDERYHLEKSTEAACRYINDSHKKYNNWTITAASYNVGRRGIDRQINRQKESDYYNLLLNDETARYLFRILSFKLVFEDPIKYNFYLSQDDLYPQIPYKIVDIDKPVESWADFAQENHTNYKILKKLNPWLRDSMLTNKSAKTYKIKVPKRGVREKI